MNRGQLVKAVAAHTKHDVKHVESVLEGMTDVITAVVSKGEPVTIQGFAKFAKVERAARMGRNPRTGEPIRIKASKRVRVSAMKAFKDTVMSPTHAPKLQRGVWPTSRELLAQQASERRDADRAASGASRGTKAAGKKAAAKRTTAKRAPAKRSATRAPAKRTTAKRATATRRPATKRAVKRTTAKRAPARRTTAKRTAARR